MLSTSHSIPSRKLHWLSSINTNETTRTVFDKLQGSMQSFYSNQLNYYENISFSNSCWNDINSLVQQDILKKVLKMGSVLEVGCGEASILSHPAISPKCYTGVDFSDELMSLNLNRFPDANFIKIQDSLKLPVNNEEFDMVFSHYVIEHSVFPHRFLLEKIRVLKQGGEFRLVCPNFLGIGRMTSQRRGFSEGNGREKFKKGRLIDAIITSFDAKIRIPFISYFYRKKALASPQFFINVEPTCFMDSFIPDVDAVYLTFEPEIKSFLQEYITWHSLEQDLETYCKSNNIIYLKGIKK